VMDGIEATRRIRDPRSEVINHYVPVIAMTASVMENEQKACLSAGMNDFVPKPVSMDALREALKKWLCTLVAESAEAGLQRESGNAESEAPLFDWTGMLLRLEWDNALAQVVIKTFLEDVPLQIRALKDLVESGDAAGSARQAHSIRGAAASVGGERLRGVASEMERAADAGDLYSVATRMQDLELQFSQLRNAMRAGE
jgi:HPt (histidine-containing phosphotransfer) domain-containing protein